MASTSCTRTFPEAGTRRRSPSCRRCNSNWKPDTPLHRTRSFFRAITPNATAARPFVHNGLDLAEYIFGTAKKKWDLFPRQAAQGSRLSMGRDAAQRTGRQLIIAGGWRPSFTGAVKYVGEVDGKRKAVLLARARCLWDARAVGRAVRPADDRSAVLRHARARHAAAGRCRESSRRRWACCATRSTS